MTQKLKALAVAMVALSAIAGTSSAATAAEFHSEASSTLVAGTSTTTFRMKTTAGELICSSTTFSGTAPSKTTASILVDLGASECHLIILGSTVSSGPTFNECGYRLNASGSVDIVCPPGKEMAPMSVGCNIKIGPQTGLKAVSYKTNGSHIDVTINISNLKYTHSGISCGTGSGTDGTMTTTMTISGKNTSGVASKVWFE
jgi:hypothetical protein